MSGGAQQQQGQQSLTAPNNPANMPTWQKGLYGAMTGNPAFGANAPFIHQMLMGQQQGQPQPQRPMPQQMQRPMPQVPMQGAPAPAAQGSPFGGLMPNG